MSDDGDGGDYEEWLDALAHDEVPFPDVDPRRYYLACESGHTSIPPRRVCPHCGDDLTERVLPADGRIETYTVVHVATPEFADRTPYVTAIADFGDVSFTGLVRDVDPEDVEVGMPVEVRVGIGPKRGQRVVVFSPR